MPRFENLLKREIEVLRDGSELLSNYVEGLEAGRKVEPADLRMAVHAMQIIFESFHLGKELKLLYPALKNSVGWADATPDDLQRIELNKFKHSKVAKTMLELRLAIELYENNNLDHKRLLWNLKAFVELIASHTEVEHEELMKIARRTLTAPEEIELRKHARDFDQGVGLDVMSRAKQIVAALRLSKRSVAV
ncbi:hypothetical protein BH10BDE1_BH10BDE1_23090 [soil metagenome]